MRHDGCLRRSGSLRRRAEPYGSEGWGFESLRARHPVTVRVVPFARGPADRITEVVLTGPGAPKGAVAGLRFLGAGPTRAE